jgi:putative oxidoreductase
MKNCPIKGTLSKYKDYAPLVLRLIVGIVFLAHGWGKAFGSAPGLDAWLGMAAGLSIPAWLAYVIAYGELLGGLALILGFATEYFALLLAAIMLGAIFLVHLKNGLIGPQGYEYPLTLFAASMALALSGASKLSLDAKCCKG